VHQPTGTDQRPRWSFEALVRGGDPGEQQQTEAFLKRIAALKGERYNL